MGADERWAVIVSVLADRPNYKAGGTNPFEAPIGWPQWLNSFAGGVPPAPWNLAATRQAYRHGGCVPWALIREGKTTPRVSVNGGPTTFVVGTLVAPTGAAYYLLEKVGVAPTASSTFLATTIASFVLGAFNVTGGRDKTYLPLSEYHTGAAPLIERFAHPAHPLLGATLTNGPAGETTLGLATEMGLVKAGVTALNVRTLGSQVQYFFKLAGLGYTFSNLQPAPFPATVPPVGKDHSQYPMTCVGGAWTADDTQDSLGPRAASGSYQMTAAIRNGWAYCADIDANTGAVTAIVPVGEPCVVAASVLDEFVNNVGGNTPAACAMTWAGARKIRARADGDIHGPFLSPGAGAGILRWRPANPWRFVMHLRRYGWAFGQPAVDDWTAGAAAGQLAGIVHPTDFIQPQPYGAGGIGAPVQLFRGLRARDSIAVSGGWNTLATFAFPSSTTEVDGVLGGTLPTIGQEIIISGESGYVFAPPFFPPNKVPISFVLFPDGAPTPVALPVAMGGVLQGGAP